MISSFSLSPRQRMSADDRHGGSTSAVDPFAGVATEAWERLRAGVEAETGMDFAGTRLARLKDAVRRLLARAGTGVDLPSLLTDPQNHGPLLERLTAELTVGESFFFRNEHHFRALREHVAPQILQENAQRREIRVWSAGCAGGEEPYSLAILLDEMLASRPDWRLSILATDLNPDFLERARQAVFRRWSFRQTQIHQDPRYFSQEGDAHRLTDRVREHVRFAYLNLVKDVFPSPLTGTLGLDLILFRNVAIYLRPEVTQAILARFREALRPGGWLLLGETEVAMSPPPGFAVRRLDRATFYQKTSGQPASFLATARFAAPPAPVVRSSVRSTPAPSAMPPPAATPAPPALEAPVPSSASAEQLAQCVLERRFDEAEQSLARTYPRRERAWLRLAYVQALLGAAESARARRMLDVCLQEEPLLLEAHLLKASFAEEAGDLTAAEAAYRRALYLDRNCAMAHFHLALVQQQSGDNAGAARSLQTTLRLAVSADPRAAVPGGEGVCYGRLQEMAEVLLNR
ncbi:MAG: hypothetical protein KY475_07260 [Planctomycetes bacterium]|nr:hypothetical protein [Planctomycetota bacterium]